MQAHKTNAGDEQIQQRSPVILYREWVGLHGKPASGTPRASTTERQASALGYDTVHVPSKARWSVPLTLTVCREPTDMPLFLE